MRQHSTVRRIDPVRKPALFVETPPRPAPTEGCAGRVVIAIVALLSFHLVLAWLGGRL